MSKYAMTMADSIRATHSSSVLCTDMALLWLAIPKHYINKVLAKGYDVGKLDAKWMKRMRRDLLRGEIVGEYQFHGFTKSGELVDVSLDQGSGKIYRMDADKLLSLWRFYYGIFR